MRTRIKTIADKAANLSKRTEERLAPDWVLLTDLPRSLQLDGYTCGAQCAFMVLSYYGKATSIKNVTKELGTTSDGTTSTQLRTLFKRRKFRPLMLRPATLAKLKKEINAGHPVVVCVDTDHFAVVYGYGEKCVFVADPSIRRAPWCKHATDQFLSRWDRWGMVVRPSK
jgi:ABC-type bacteriocin/lantibiotic exporter with double-glycine peptidase domain